LVEGRDNGEPKGFKLARIADLRDLEGGTYWPALQPHFQKPHFKTLQYRLQGGTRGGADHGRTVALRGASGVGDLDVAYIADRLAATLTIADAGIPDYCLTAVSRGRLNFTGVPGAKAMTEIDEKVGLLYRGVPGTSLTAGGDHQRLAVWIPAASMGQRLSALLGGPLAREVVFEPVFDWRAPHAQSLQRLLRLMAEETASPLPFAGSDIASRSFADLVLYTLLHAVPHNHSRQLLREASPATPGTVRRAEQFIRAHLEDPIALHDVADAAGCSVRSLQLGFRRFRDTTPLAAIRQARLEAAREALLAGEPGDTVTNLALRFGFGNPGRFAQFYKAAFGESPREALRRRGSQSRDME
jgi:AraC-like DNA-binding protein